jgi:hypothetical protein
MQIALRPIGMFKLKYWPITYVMKWTPMTHYYASYEYGLLYTYFSFFFFGTAYSPLLLLVIQKAHTPAVSLGPERLPERVVSMHPLN